MMVRDLDIRRPEEGQSMAKFSIIVPTLNEEAYLPKLLKSLRLQTFQDFEVIVVDGGSKDGTVQKARALGAHVIIRKSGIAQARNIGAASSKGEILIFLDADCVVPKVFLEKAKEILEKGSAGCLMGRPEPLETSLFGRIAYTFGWLLSFLNLTMPGYMGFIVRRMAFELVGGYDESLIYAEDMDFQRRLSRITKIEHPKDLIVFSSTRRWRGPKSGGPREILMIVLRVLRYILFKRSGAYYPIYHK
jgi:glycosyltransferase involved in cell wall biosynthesis